MRNKRRGLKWGAVECALSAWATTNRR